MDIARCARLQLNSSMGKIPESVEIVPVGGNIEVDKSLNTYLTIYKGMTSLCKVCLMSYTGIFMSYIFIFFCLLVMVEFYLLRTIERKR